MSEPLHLDLDAACCAREMSLRTIQAQAWGRRLRCLAPVSIVEAFYREIQPQLGDFVLYGSGDFHYLSALWLRRCQEPVTVLCFDNHPDWDIRPPRWGCGGWVNRALELRNVRQVSVWGCGNFELAWPSRLFANSRGLKSGQLEVHAWAERQGVGTQRRFNCMTRENWRERFERFVQTLNGQAVYVTIDMDCLIKGEAVTNWENGLFTCEDLVWALTRLRERARLTGGDLCGAFSPPVYDRWTQRFAGNWDHPKLPGIESSEARRINQLALVKIWPALVGSGG